MSAALLAAAAGWILNNCSLEEVKIQRLRASCRNQDITKVSLQLINPDF